MTLELPDIVIKTLIKALNDGTLIQKQARLCDLAALDFIPIEILPHLKLHHQKAIAKSPVTSQKIFENFRQLVPKNYRKFDNLDDPEYLRKLAQSEDWRERTKVAENHNTPIDVLEILAKDPFGNAGRCPLIRKAVAENQAAPNRILEHLAKDWCRSVRSGVASNPSTPIYLLENLATDIYGVPVFYALARNPLIPSYLLIKIARLTTDIMILELIAEHSNTPSEILSELLKYGEENNYWLNRIRIAVASNVSTPACILKKLYIESIQADINVAQGGCSETYINTQLTEIKAAIACNPHTPVSLLKEFISQTDASILIGLAKNPNLPHSLQKILVARHSNLGQVQNCLAWNSNTSLDIFRNIIGVQNALKSENIRVRYRMAQRPQGLNLLIDRCLKPERCLPEQNSLNRVLAGIHPAISQQQIEDLYHSDNWLDRLAVVCNFKCSKEYLLKLTQDKDDVVKQTARELLERKD